MLSDCVIGHLIQVKIGAQIQHFIKLDYVDLLPIWESVSESQTNVPLRMRVVNCELSIILK